MTSRADEQLMLAYAKGDAIAFDLLYERYRGPLYRFILRQVNDPVLANDLYQLCWEKLVKNRDKYRAQSPFPAWLFLLARNTVIDHFRRPANSGTTELPELESDSKGPEESALEFETERSLAAAISALPAEQREMVLLRLEGGFDLATIADITGVGIETCKSRLRYAIARLKTDMQSAPPSAGGIHENA
jgi:RNA polymerase sigma-70 factor (ECF subfamily)